MINIENVNKTFDSIRAVDNVSFQINDENVFGMLGTNGAGKSTLLRMIAGVLKPDTGNITMDGKKIYDNVKVKQNIFYIADTPYFFSNANPIIMKNYYVNLYPEFNTEKYIEYLKNFGLDEKRKINTYSKGMKKQLALLCGICSNAKYLLCDETFDGLDPMMRQGIKSIFAKEIDERGLTPIIASHNLRELEDICDHVGLLHKGGVLLSKDIEDLKLNIQRVQCVFKNEEDEKKFTDNVAVVTEDKRGQLRTYTIRGTREEAVKAFEGIDTLFYEILPLSLEEIFISETEVVGYDIKKLIMG